MIHLRRYDAQCATSGTEALAAVRHDPPPDAVILDILMSDVDGLEVLRRLAESCDAGSSIS